MQGERIAMVEDDNVSEQMAPSVPDGPSVQQLSLVDQLPNGDANISAVENSGENLPQIEPQQQHMDQQAHMDYQSHGEPEGQEEHRQLYAVDQMEHQHPQVEHQLQLEQHAQGELQPEMEPQESSAPVTEEDKLWNIVKANPADFNSWTLLISEIEKTENIIKIRKVYDTFLAEYPLCYGYWKKYADHEGRLGSPEKIDEVYERSVQAVTYSVDIWMHYSIHAIAKYDDPDMIRRLFERGVAYVGTDYLSHLLWDKYIEFENSQNNISGVMQILTRILQIPIQQLDRYYASFKSMTTMHSLQELMTPEETAASAVAAAEAEQLPPTEAAVVPEGEEALKPEPAPGWSDSLAFDRFIAIREAMYKVSKEQDVKIRDFELGIRRPYFHVKPLDNLQLANWHQYLDFVEKEGDFGKIVKLFERCLIASANYPEYWIRYVQCMDRIGSVEYATDALHRSTQIFVKRRPEIHLFAARRYELLGDVSAARSEYELLNSGLAVGLLEGVIKFANFERRQGDLEKACSIFDAAIQIEKSKEDSQMLPFLFIQYARFLDQIAVNVDKARELLSSALQQLPLSKTLVEAVIQMEAFRPGVKAFDYLEPLVKQATAPTRPDGSQGLNASDREDIASIFLEFVDLFGDAEVLKKTEDWYREFFPCWRATSDSKKRSSDGATSDRVKMAKTSNAAAVYPAQSGPQAYANGQSQQWGAGYAQQPQAWQQPVAQQASQGQQQPPPQQWNAAAYPSQPAGYAGYGGYGAYAPPQQQIPPQQSAYTGYSQSYAPQSYTQPAAPYTTPQPQATPQQGYYGYY